MIQNHNNLLHKAIVTLFIKTSNENENLEEDAYKLEFAKQMELDSFTVLENLDTIIEKIKS
mgnify:CR=1 FL=1